MGTAIVLLLVAGAAVLAVRQIIKDKKAGKSISCGGDCSRCVGCLPDRKPDDRQGEIQKVKKRDNWQKQPPATPG